MQVNSFVCLSLFCSFFKGCVSPFKSNGEEWFIQFGVLGTGIWIRALIFWNPFNVYIWDHLKNLEKEEQSKPKASGNKEIIKISTEISESTTEKNVREN